LEKSPTTAEYPLRLSLRQSIGMVGVSVVLGAVFVGFATWNQKALNLFGLITLSPEGARMFFWSVAAFFLVVALPFGLAIAWKGMMAKQRIAFRPDGLLLQRSTYSSSHVVVPYSDLLAVRELARANSRVIELQLRDRKFWIGLSWVDSAATFDAILVKLLCVIHQIELPKTETDVARNRSNR